jgi:hypothetical protein
MNIETSEQIRRFVCELRAAATSLWRRDPDRLTKAGQELSIYLDCQADDHAVKGGRYAGNYELLIMFTGGGGVPDEPWAPKTYLLDLTYQELLVAFVVNELDRTLRLLGPRPSRNVVYGSQEAPEAEAIFSALLALREAQGLAASRQAH